MNAIASDEKYQAMSFSQIAAKYKVSVKVLRCWIKTFCPELKRPEKSYIYTPLQINIIVAACGEFPS